MKTIYECSQSKGVKWFTAIIFLIVVLAILLEVYYVSKGANLTEAIIVTAVLLVVSISCFLIFPMYIISDDEGIGIRTLARTIRIPFESIDHIERIEGEKQLLGVTTTIRLLGVGGVFGYIVWFHTKGIGTFRSYVTDTKKVFLIYRTKPHPQPLSQREGSE